MSAQPDQPYDDQPERHRPFSTLLSNLRPTSDDDPEATATDEVTATDEDTAVAPRPTFTAREDLPEAPAAGLPTTGLSTTGQPTTGQPTTGQPATAADLDPVDDTTGEPVSGTVYEAEPADDEPLDDAVDEEPVLVQGDAVTDEDGFDEPADAGTTASPVPPAPRANGEALPGFRRASTDVDGARGFPRHAAPGTADVIDEPVAGTTAAAAPSALPSTSVVDEPLLSDATDFRARWQRAQAGFVDDPREAVGEAADLIEQTAQALVVAVRQRQRQLRESWDQNSEADTTAGSVSDTEQLRLMMQRYRALFNQLCRP